MKANRKFKENKEAISAVIGVILMVAITVAIAAVSFVYFTGMLGGPKEEKENASCILLIDNNKIKITLIKAGDKMPNDGYNFDTSVKIRLNGTELSETNFFVGNTGWEIGENLFIGDNPPVLDDSAGDVSPLAAGEYSVTVTIIDTVIFDDIMRVT